MSITIEVDLPEPVVSEARKQGLLEPARLADLITREIESERDGRGFFEIARDIRNHPGEPMSPEEIQAEIETARAEQRAREARS
jgi:hypothetical protein